MLYAWSIKYTTPANGVGQATGNDWYSLCSKIGVPIQVYTEVHQ